MSDFLKNLDWLAVANVAVNVIVLVVLPVVAVLIRKAKGKEKMLEIARQAYVYVEAIAQATPGKIDDKLAEGVKTALAIAGKQDADSDVKNLLVGEFARLAEEHKRAGSLNLGDLINKGIIK